MENRGIIHEGIIPSSVLLGGPDLPDINPSGDWSKYLPKFETQRKFNLDTMNCVQASRANVCDTYARFYGLQLDISERLWYWLTGCTERGNTYSACDYHIRLGGAVNEETWPWDKPMTREVYGQRPPDAIVEEARAFLDAWTFGQLQYVPSSVEAMRSALRKGPLWFCNDVHSMMIYRIDDRIRVFDTEANDTLGYGSFPLDYVSEIVACYLAPFTPKHLVPMPALKLPPDCLVVVVDGHGDRLMNIDGTKLYQDDAGKILLEVTARNAKTVNGIQVSQPFPIVHVKTADIAAIPRVNLKGEPV